MSERGGIITGGVVFVVGLVVLLVFAFAVCFDDEDDAQGPPPSLAAGISF